MQQIIKLVYKLLLLLFMITVTNCGLVGYSPSEDESDEETLENIKKLNQEIEAHKNLEASVENKEATISSNHVIIKGDEEYIKKREEQVTADIKMAIESAGNKVPTKCIRCNWTSSMTEESFDKLADKYHRGGITQVKQHGGCEFWNSCPLCAKEKNNEYYKNRIKERKEEIDRLKSDLDRKEKPLLEESRKYIKKTESSHRIICKQSARKHELKRERNQARELVNKQAREIEALRNKTAEKEKETRLLKEERDRLEREKEEMKKKVEEKERENKLLKEERDRLEREKEEMKKKVKEREKEEALIKEEKARVEEQKEKMENKKEKQKRRKHEKKLNTAKELLKNKLDIDVIISITKLSKEEIEKLI